MTLVCSQGLEMNRVLRQDLSHCDFCPKARASFQSAAGAPQRLQVSRWTAEQEDIVSWKFINMHWVWQHSAIVSNNVVKGFVAERNLSIHQQ